MFRRVFLSIIFSLLITMIISNSYAFEKVSGSLFKPTLKTANDSKSKSSSKEYFGASVLDSLQTNRGKEDSFYVSDGKVQSIKELYKSPGAVYTKRIGKIVKIDDYYFNQLVYIKADKMCYVILELTVKDVKGKITKHEVEIEFHNFEDPGILEGSKQNVFMNCPKNIKATRNIRPYKWTSSNVKVATIDNRGYLIPVSEGKTWINAYYKNIGTSTCLVTVLTDPTLKDDYDE